MNKRIYCSWEQWSEIMDRKPCGVQGCKTPERETDATCITTDIDPSAIAWLESNGVPVKLAGNTIVKS